MNGLNMHYGALCSYLQSNPPLAFGALIISSVGCGYLALKIGILAKHIIGERLILLILHLKIFSRHLVCCY